MKKSYKMNLLIEIIKNHLDNIWEHKPIYLNTNSNNHLVLLYKNLFSQVFQSTLLSPFGYKSIKLNNEYKNIMTDKFEKVYKSYKFNFNQDLYLDIIVKSIESNVLSELKKYWILDNKTKYSSFLIVGGHKTFKKTKIIDTLLEYFKMLDSNIVTCLDDQIDILIGKKIEMENLKIIVDEKKIVKNENIYEQIPNFESYDNIIIIIDSFSDFDDQDKFKINQVLTNLNVYINNIIYFQ